MLRKWSTPLLLALLASGTVWFFSQQPDNLSSPLSPQHAAVADTFMENFTTRVLDAQGKTRYQLSAAYMAHYPHDDHTEVLAPLLTMYRPDNQHWEFKAESGLLENGTDLITLQGQVFMQEHTPAGPDNSIHVVTSDLRIVPARSYAETDAYARIKQGASQMEATGLQADLASNHLQLLSQVRGIYETRP